MYTPTTGVVRTDYIRTQFTDVDKAGEEFDRWLVEVIREAKEEAWEEGMYAGKADDYFGNPDNPYRQEGAANNE